MDLQPFPPAQTHAASCSICSVDFKMYTDVGQVLVMFHQSFVQLNAGKNCKCSALESYLSLRPIKEAMGRKRHASFSGPAVSEIFTKLDASEPFALRSGLSLGNPMMPGVNSASIHSQNLSGSPTGCRTRIPL
jgi:hypothetical protein